MTLTAILIIVLLIAVVFNAGGFGTAVTTPAGANNIVWVLIVLILIAVLLRLFGIWI